MYPTKKSCHLEVIGSTNSGKSFYILNLLKTHFKNVFNEIVIFCPTVFVNKTYLNSKFIWQDDNVFIVNPQDKLNECLEYYFNLFKSPETNTLFIIDDCSAEKSIVKKRQTLSKLAFSGRHHNISVWLLTQKLHSINKDFRENCRWCVVFWTKDRDSFQDCLRENDIVPHEEINKIKETLKSKKHSKLVLILEQPTSYFIE
jgi:hypothetical protein